MRRNSKIAASVLAMLLCVSSVTLPVSAGESAVNEPQFIMTTDKTEYSGTDNIQETVVIQNVTDNSVTDIVINGNIPEGYVTENGKSAPDQWTSSVSEVAADETAEVVVTFSKKVTAGQDTTQNDNQNNSGNQEQITPEKNGDVNTGDSAKIVLWVCVGLAGLTGLVLVIKKRKGMNLLTMFLAVTLAGNLSLAGSSNVHAAEVETIEKTVDLTKEITVDGKKVTLTAQVTYHAAATEDGTEDMGSDLSYEGYTLKWNDEFDGEELNRDDWNVELHDPGWVNAEWQEYVDSEENIYLEDGKLVIKPIKTGEGDDAAYTSGRINTQNKHTYTYGLFEARVKVPEGKGYLPAFWLMANDENLYGQWPRCGEIDIMEVLGDTTESVHGTIHYGNPHNQSQGTYTLEEGSFADDYHTFAVEWEPGKISWYVDGQLYHTENDWYSATEGQGELTYPAPFDQPFYVILNLAVGGSWVGYPDETTDFENASYEVDYVRVYQKDSYDENVTKPEEEKVVLRDPDENGNYVVNGDFAAAEDLADEQDWIFMTAQGGEATAEIKDNEMVIGTTNAGTVDYSVQLVQPNLPMQKGASYKLTFDAYADEERTMIVDISAPDNNWVRYMSDTKINLTEEKQTYEFEFRMTHEDDANGRLEFNMGNQGSVAGIKISNVVLEKTAYEEIVEDETKTVLADGNHVYNGSFQEGVNRLGYWDVTNDADAEVVVTNENNVRRLMITAPEGTSETNPVVISQSGLALAEGSDYAFEFDTEGTSGTAIDVTVAGISYVVDMTGEESTFTSTFTPAAGSEKDIVFTITEPGTYYLDNVSIVEDSLIKNGSFAAGFASYEPFVDSSISSDVTYVVDSLTENNAADFTINNTGDQAWKIQLKQNDIKLEKGQWYKLTLDAKSTIDRQLMFAIQRNGNLHNDDWTPYSGEKIVDLTGDYQTYEIIFQMSQETDEQSVLSISMGAVGGTQITQQHRICIDNINLEKVDAPKVEEVPAGENILKNADFSTGSENWVNAITAPGAATAVFENNKAVYEISNVGTADWNVQLKQEGITLEQGVNYQIKFKVTSTEARVIKLAMLSPSYAWYGGADITLEKGVEKEVVIDLTMTSATDANTTLVVSMGIIEGVDTPLSTITLSEFSLVKVA